MTRKEQKEQRRREILMSALELFVKRGYYGTKISDIAQSVQMSTGLLFHYFDSKEELYLELVRMGVEGTKRPQKLENLPPEEFFETFLEQLFQYARKEPWVFQMFVLMVQAAGSGMPEAIREVTSTIDQVEFSAKIIEKGQKTGVFRDGDPKMLATCFWAGVQGVMMRMALEPDFTPDAKWLASMLKP